jgi:hypothetical protein
MVSPLLSAGYLRAVAFTIFISTVFALVWGINGSLALPGAPRIVSILLVLLISALLLAVAFNFTRSASHQPSLDPQDANPFRNRLYNIVVVAQFVAIFLVARLLTAIGYPDAIISAVAVIVGLHFFALIPVFRSRRFAVVGVAMIILGLVSLLLDPVITLNETGETLGLRSAVVGLGCAIILWAGVAPLVLETLQQTQRNTG